MSDLKIINNQLAKVESRFIELTDKQTWEREKSFAIQHFRRNPKLIGGNPQSILEAIMNVANVGLTLNPASKLAYLVPRFNSGQGMDICLEPSYQGLVKLITDTGSAVTVYANIVYKGDEFQEVLGTETSITHIPKRATTEPILVYAVAVLHNGTKQVEVMTVEEINSIRDKSESYKAFSAGKIRSCVWADHWGEMARKTVIRRLTKYLPKTDQYNKLAEAIRLDETDYTLSDNQVNYIHTLLNTAALDWSEKEKIERELPDYTPNEASELIQRLKDNQLDPIASGFNYNQTDIKTKINNEVNE